MTKPTWRVRLSGLCDVLRVVCGVSFFSTFLRDGILTFGHRSEPPWKLILSCILGTLFLNLAQDWLDRKP